MFDFSRENIDLIKADLKDKLPKKRYEHTLGVAYTSAALAKPSSIFLVSCTTT